MAVLPIFSHAVRLSPASFPVGRPSASTCKAFNIAAGSAGHQSNSNFNTRAGRAYVHPHQRKRLRRKLNDPKASSYSKGFSLPWGAPAACQLGRFTYTILSAHVTSEGLSRDVRPIARVVASTYVFKTRKKKEKEPPVSTTCVSKAYAPRAAYNIREHGTDLASEGDEDGEELPLVPDDHAVADARELGLELVLSHNKSNRERKPPRQSSNETSRSTVSSEQQSSSYVTKRDTPAVQCNSCCGLQR